MLSHPADKIIAVLYLKIPPIITLVTDDRRFLFMKKSKNNHQLFKIVLTSLLIAMNVVLEKFLNLQKTFELDVSFGLLQLPLRQFF